MDETSLQREYGEHLVEEVLAGRMTRRQLVRRATVIGLSLPAISTLLAACGGEEEKKAPAPPKPGGTLRVGLVPPTAAVEPVTMYDAGAIAVVQQVAEYLAWVENDGSLRRVLATGWEPDAKAQSWTFTIRQGVAFSDGRPLTADDVVATFDRLTDPKSQSAALSNFQGILSKGGTEKVDETTVRFNLDRPFVDFPYLVASPNYNAVMLPADYDGKFEQKPVGTGPFTLTKYVPKQSASFKKNPNYWQQGRPLLDGVELRFFAEVQPQVLALQGGEIDMMLSTPLAGSQALFGDPNIKVLSTRSTMSRFVHMRVDQEPFTDKRVRQALGLSLDRQKIVDSLFQGKADIGNDTVFAPLYPISPDLPRAQDVDQAKSLLAEAGKSGVSITITTEEYLEVPQFGVLLQEMIKGAGLDAKLDKMTQAEYYGSGENQPWLQVPMGVTDWAGRAIPSQFIIPAFTCDGVWNSAKWCNKEFDRLAKDLDASLDESTRRGIAEKMATIMQDETPSIIAYWINALRATGKKVRGVESNGSEFLDLTKASLAA